MTVLQVNYWFYEQRLSKITEHTYSESVKVGSLSIKESFMNMCISATWATLYVPQRAKNMTFYVCLQPSYSVYFQRTRILRK